MFASECRTIEDLAGASGQTVLELWRYVCAEAGFDECEPWEGFPAWPKLESGNRAAADDGKDPDYYEQQVKQMLPRLVKHN
jgi:hypothetical protein